MKVGLIADAGNADGTIGGAELTMQEFAAAAPEGIELVDPSDAERVVVGNCTGFGADLIERLEGKPVFRYWNDVARNDDPVLRAWLVSHASHIFTSPAHSDYLGLEGEIIPPAIDLDAYRRPDGENGEGTVAIGAYQNPGKGGQLLVEWAEANEQIDIYGTGSFIPSALNYKGSLDSTEVAPTLWRYERFIHLPMALEPFGRAVVEAWAAGLELVVNRLVGALWWVRNDPDALGTAGEDFWRLVGG